MSIAKILFLVGACVLIAGCAPITGIKGLAALVLSLMAVAGAGWTIVHDKSENRVCLKARELEQEITAHEEKYHRSPSDGAVVTMNPAKKGNGVAGPDTESHLSQRM